VQSVQFVQSVQRAQFVQFVHPVQSVQFVHHVQSVQFVHHVQFFRDASAARAFASLPQCATDAWLLFASVIQPSITGGAGGSGADDSCVMMLLFKVMTPPNSVSLRHRWAQALPFHRVGYRRGRTSSPVHCTRRRRKSTTSGGGCLDQKSAAPQEYAHRMAL
jgi:hypothetical protein